MRRRVVGALAVLALAGSAALASPAPQDPEGIFARAKAEWRARARAPFVQFSLLERYTWRGRAHDNWWQAAYRSADHALVLRRTIVSQQEEGRLKGSPIKLNLTFHRAAAGADRFDTNPNADAFPILDPLIEPDACSEWWATSRRRRWSGRRRPRRGRVPPRPRPRPRRSRPRPPRTRNLSSRRCAS